MSEQKRVVAVVMFTVTPEEFGKVSSEAGMTLQHRLPAIPGFIEGTVLVNESTTRIGIVSEWKSRQNWADAQWDEEVEQAVADLFQDTASYELKMYFPLAKATSAVAK